MKRETNFKERRFFKPWQIIAELSYHHFGAVKVLEKHKEKQKEAYLEEEKAIELRQFSEIGVQRFFIQSKEREEEELELQKLIDESEEEMEENYGY